MYATQEESVDMKKMCRCGINDAVGHFGHDLLSVAGQICRLDMYFEFSLTHVDLYMLSLIVHACSNQPVV